MKTWVLIVFLAGLPKPHVLQVPGFPDRGTCERTLQWVVGRLEARGTMVGDWWSQVPMPVCVPGGRGK